MIHARPVTRTINAEPAEKAFDYWLPVHGRGLETGWVYDLPDALVVTVMDALVLRWASRNCHYDCRHADISESNFPESLRPLR
jgi:hypothetical protein